MSKQPPVSETLFLKQCNNHAELARKLLDWGIPSADLPEYAKFICAAWIKLGEEHLIDAKVAQNAGLVRSVYSRAYYAAYNASKAVRYLHKGAVSLAGDDHKKASVELPDEFPDMAQWSRIVGMMLEDRQRADYDNWVDTPTQYTMTTTDAIQKATDFISVAWTFLGTKHGLKK